MDEMVTIPRSEYDALVGARETLEDIKAYDRAMVENRESVPAEYADRIIDGESPLRVFREFRRLTQAALADRSGVDRTRIAGIESGRETGSVATLDRLAETLGMQVDDLIWRETRREAPAVDPADHPLREAMADRLDAPAPHRSVTIASLTRNPLGSCREVCGNSSLAPPSACGSRRR